MSTRSSSLRCVSAAEHYCRTVLQNGQDKTRKASPKKQSIMEYLPGLPQDTKPLRSCSGNRAKMLLKTHLRLKCHSQYNKVIRLLQHSSSNSQCGWMGTNCAWPGDYHSLSFTRIQFYPPKVAPLTNLDEVTAQGLCYCNSNAWGWHNSYQNGVIDITDQLILQNEKSSEVYRRNNNERKTLPCSTLETTLTSLLRQEYTITRCDRFERNCVNIDNTEPPIPTEQCLYRIPWWLTLSKAALKSICMILASCPLSNALCSVCDTDKSASQVHVLNLHCNCKVYNFFVLYKFFTTIIESN